MMPDSDTNVLPDRLLTALKAVCPPILADAARAVRRRRQITPASKVPPHILRDPELYTPRFSPWEGLGEFKDVMARVAPHSVVSRDRVWVLYTLAQQARHVPGNFWECGVYKGGTALMLASVAGATSGKQLHLFDTFDGMPDSDPDRDYYDRGVYTDTSLESVRGLVGADGHIFYHVGRIPESFNKLEAERVALAHIDVVLYQSVFDCCEFIYPRLSGGGFIVFDDYGFSVCPGARAAVDEFFADKPECPLVLPTGQAIVVKLP